MDYKESFGFFAPLLRNKYSLSLILFFVWIVFFDTNSLIERTFHLRQVHQLEKDKMFYEEKIREDRAKLEELESNPANLEKFAREHYLMKKDNEDIFIVDHR
ncbi:MAG: septum formation initiator family protein [Bacteroidales bacterium]|jgi:cell division protein FtsB|nr:septum formation initiator family protein [Bacteroidales bacterium]